MPSGIKLVNTIFPDTNELAEIFIVQRANPLAIMVEMRDDERFDLYYVINHRIDSKVVNFSQLKPTGTGVTPNFKDVKIIDFGHAIRFGSYEAAVDALVNE